MNNFTFLIGEQIFGNNQLEIFKKIRYNVDYNRFSILLKVGGKGSEKSRRVRCWCCYNESACWWCYSTEQRVFFFYC